MPSLLQPSAENVAEVIGTRRHLHQHPELGFEEYQTSAFIQQRLAELGLILHPCPTPTGAVATLDSGRPGRRVMLRADIDALPIQESSGVDFSSQVEGKMHACGHDAHIAILLGVARVLSEEIAQLSGSYVFCFQPAEEGLGGAQAMLKGGLLVQHQPDVIIGLHISSFLPLRTVVTRPGLMWAGYDGFQLTFIGPGGHGALLKREGNVIAAQAAFIQQIESVVEGLEYEGTACHSTVGHIVSDGAANVVPRKVQLKGTLRTFTPQLREQARARLQQLAEQTAAEFRVQAQLEFVFSAPPLVNNAEVTKVILEVGQELVGEQAFVLDKPLTVSDDFADFLEQIPGCYFMLGAAPSESEPTAAHHSPTFRIDESALELGVQMLSNLGMRLASPD